MPRALSRLTALEVKRASKPGLHPDGAGLYLQIARSGAKSWIFRFMQNGTERYMGLGPLHTVSLADARERATECRRLRLAGFDPIEVRKSKRTQQRLEAARSVTFAQCTSAYFDAHKASWRNPRHAQVWATTMAVYVAPVIGQLPVQDIDVGLVLKVLEPIWLSKTPTAVRIRGRIESILDWATSRGYRTGENPARWRGHLQNLLPKPTKISSVRHFSALPYQEVAQFLASTRSRAGVPARALEFAVLTAARVGEVIGALWEEINLGDRVWTIPAARMKAAREHRVPLSSAAIAILFEMRKIATNGFVFPGARTGKPVTNAGMLHVLQRIGRSNLTIHGFRSSFRDWAAERTNFPSEVAEMALAHTVGDKVEAAYRRGDLFEKRRHLAEAWARFCDASEGNGHVMPIRRAASRD